MGQSKRHDTIDTTDLCPCQLVTELLWGNWCNGFWPYDEKMTTVRCDTTNANILIREKCTLLMSRFCGLRSRCRTLWLWQNSRPRS